jgi:hypothetical protein
MPVSHQLQLMLLLLLAAAAVPPTQSLMWYTLADEC